MKRSVHIFRTMFIGLLLALTAGCSPVFPPLLAPSEESGAMAISVFGASTMQQSASTVRVELFTKEKPSVHDSPVMYQEIPLTPQGGNVQFQNIGIGRWFVQVSLLDSARVPVYEGNGQAVVTEGDMARVEIWLHPLPGGLVVEIDLGDTCIYVQGHGGCLADVDRNGQLTVEPGQKEAVDKINFAWEPGNRTKTLPRVSLPPGTYDFQIGFYDGSRIAANVLFQSRLYQIDIEPGYDKHVLWQPETGSLDIELIVDGP